MVNEIKYFQVMGYKHVPEIISTLNCNKMNFTEICKSLGLNYGQCKRLLDDMLSIGIIEKQKLPNMTMYSLSKFGKKTLKIMMDIKKYEIDKEYVKIGVGE